MEILKFLDWKIEKKPQDVIVSNLGDLAFLGNSEAFKVYKDIIEWRIHNLAEQSLFNPQPGTYDQGYSDGLRQLLKDFRKIQEDYQKQKEK